MWTRPCPIHAIILILVCPFLLMVLPCSTNWSRVTHISVEKCPSLVHIMACRLVAWPSYHLKQCWTNDISRLRNTFQWHFKQNSYIFIIRLKCRLRNGGHFVRGGGEGVSWHICNSGPGLNTHRNVNISTKLASVWTLLTDLMKSINKKYITHTESHNKKFNYVNHYMGCSAICAMLFIDLELWSN